MKLCRFSSGNSHDVSFGILEDGWISPIDPGTLFEDEPRRTADKISIGSATLLAPVTPSKIVCVGRNYKAHAAEMGNPMPSEPLLFLKAPSSIIGTGETILLPPESVQVEHEGELGVVIGKRASRLSDSDDPLSFVLGYTCVNDVTARDLQRKDVQFTRGKSFDTFCPVGPYIETALNPGDVTVTTRVNGKLRQQGVTANMAFSIEDLIHYISQAMTLYPGDLIATGTPSGVSRLNDGDEVEVEIGKIGLLRNDVKTLRQL